MKGKTSTTDKWSRNDKPTLEHATSDSNLQPSSTLSPKSTTRKPLHPSGSAPAIADTTGSTTPSGSRHLRRTSLSAGTSSSTAPGSTTRLRVYKSNSTNKWVTREIAALEFLLGIPMQAERKVVHEGLLKQQEIKERAQTGSNDQDEEDESKVEVLEPPTASSHHSSTGFPTNVSHHGRWWEKWMTNTGPNVGRDATTRNGRIGEELEQPPEINPSDNSRSTTASQPPQHVSHQQVVPVIHAPGRRLEGDDATRVQIPLTADTSVITRQKNIARMAITKEWEMQVAHGIGGSSSNLANSKVSGKTSIQHVQPSMLDGRLFFSAGGSYPVQVFSLLRYEPKKEEAARRRQKLEARGGGGTDFFIMPIRDWRGISYRALLPPRKQQKYSLTKDNALTLLFDRFSTSITTEMNGYERGNGDRKDEDGRDIPSDDDDEETDEDEDTYVSGLLDDPEMVQGRHRNVMIGDRVTGCIVSSTIQFVKPKLLKADLNKQFRDRFDGWEPPKSQRKFIGARVVDGVYTLIEPGTTADDGTIDTTGNDSYQNTVTTSATGISSTTPRKRQGSVSSMSTGGNDANETIRMPPSLTLSKIRSVKQQALIAAVKAKLEISTVALAIVYFERLCLDCRVDKTNRRLSFAACILLALKLNESHVALVMANNSGNEKSATANRIQSLIRPTKKSDNMFASLLEFFTQEWNISLKHLFAAEWGVFAALQFRLHAKPSQVAFHFKRLLKSLDWNPGSYLGPEMYGYWQQELAREEFLRIEREARHEAREKRKEEKKLRQLQRELEAANRREMSTSTGRDDDIKTGVEGGAGALNDPAAGTRRSTDETAASTTLGFGSPRKPARQGSRIGGILNRLSGAKRAMSQEHLPQFHEQESDRRNNESPLKMTSSPSMPVLSALNLKDHGDDFVIDIPGIHSDDDEQTFGSNQSVAGSDEGGIMI